MTPEQAAALAAPFPSNELGLMPKPYGPKDRRTAKQRCTYRADDGRRCGGFHENPAIHINYVPVGAVYKRLREVDPAWTWRPLARDEHGQPILERGNGGNPVGIWIELEVCGVTRIGYGERPEGSTANPFKLVIGNAIKNAAKLFGVVVDDEKDHTPPATSRRPERSEPEAPADVDVETGELLGPDEVQERRLRAIAADRERGGDYVDALARREVGSARDLTRAQIDELLTELEEAK